MYFKDCLAIIAVWEVNIDPAVKTAWAEQGRVEYVRTVCCRQHYNVLALFETIHLDKDLVQCLFAFVMATAHARPTTASNSVNLVNKDNTWRVLFCLCKQITNTTCTNTYKHFNKFRTRNAKEWHISFPG